MFYRIRETIFFCYLLSTLLIEAESKCAPHQIYYQIDCENITSLEEVAVEVDFPERYRAVHVKNSIISKVPTNAFQSRYPHLHQLSLAGQGVEEIAPEAFSGLPTLSYLHLDHNSIDALPPHSFSSSLVMVSLSHNHISFIDPEACAGAEALSDLYLSENRLESLSSGLFKGCKNLQRLYVSKNQIRFIDEKTFEGAENLIALFSENNKILDISCNTFSKLKKLREVNLNSNNLTLVRNCWFSNLTNLMYFSAAVNKIKAVESNAFDNALRLSAVDLSYNELSHIRTEWFSTSKKFSDFSLLKAVALSHNAFSNLSNEDKEILCQFDSIKLNHNRLTDEDVDSLIHCPNLSYLYVKENKIKILKTESLENSSLVDLDFSYNDIENFDYSIFLKSELLDEATLSHNKITNLPRNLPGKTKIRNLRLDHNKIQSIEEDTFKNFTKLRVLDLGYNEISSVSAGAFNSLTVSLREDYFSVHLDLHLYCNKIHSFENWFVEGSNIDTLNVSYNQIKKIDVNSLKGAVSLKLLDLSYNEISELSPNSIIHFANLRSVYLRHNNLSVLSENSVVDCLRLRLLDFSFNKIKTIHPNALRNLPYLLRLSLSNNDLTVLTESMFVGTPHLSYLNVSSNEIEVISPHVFSRDKVFIQFVLDASHNKLEGMSQELFSKRSPTGTFMFDFTHNKIDNEHIETFLQNFVRDSALTVSLQENFHENRDCEVSNGKPGNEQCIVKVCHQGDCNYNLFSSFTYSM